MSGLYWSWYSLRLIRKGSEIITPTTRMTAISMLTTILIDVPSTNLRQYRKGFDHGQCESVSLWKAKSNRVLVRGLKSRPDGRILESRPATLELWNQYRCGE